MVKHSRKSVRRLVRLILGLHPPAMCLHQTLTFCPPIHDATKAKKRLNQLFDALTRRFPAMGIVYAEERQRKGGVHYHVLLLFFDQTNLPFAPSKMEESFRTLVFRAWNHLNGGILAQAANKLRPCRQKVDYLVKEARAGRGRSKLAKGDSHWWGIRNAALLTKHTTTPDKGAVASEMARIFFRMPLPYGLRFNARMMAREKASVLETSLRGGDADWQSYKQGETGRSDDISDAEYLDFRKEQAVTWRKRFDGALTPCV